MQGLHPAMAVSTLTLGSMVLDITKDTLDGALPSHSILTVHPHCPSHTPSHTPSYGSSYVHSPNVWLCGVWLCGVWLCVVAGKFLTSTGTILDTFRIQKVAGYPAPAPSVVSTNGISAGMGWRCVFAGTLVRRCALAGVVSVHRQMGGGGGSEALH